VHRDDRRGGCEQRRTKLPRTVDVALLAHLRRASEEGDVALPAFETTRAEHIRVRADGAWAQVDDVAIPLEGELHIEPAAGALSVLAPDTSPGRHGHEGR
jgi:hypothetical protein